LRNIPFIWENNHVTFNGVELIVFEAEEGTPERDKENRIADFVIGAYGGFQNLPSQSDEAGRARWEEVKAHRKQRERDKEAKRRR